MEKRKEGAAPSSALGKVLHRRATPRLQYALFHWARTAVQHDKISKARYSTLRARGHSHARLLKDASWRPLRTVKGFALFRILNGFWSENSDQKPFNLYGSIGSTTASMATAWIW